MSYFVRSRALPVATALAISTAALALFIKESHAQEAAKPTAAENVPASGAASQLPPVVVEPANKPQPGAQQASKPVKKKSEASAEPAKPKVKAAKKAAPEPVQEAVPAVEQQQPAAAEPALANATGTYNTALDLEGIELSPGTTITTAGPVVGYRALSAMSSTKTATPIEQIPQSIQVIPQQVIKDQGSVTITEALQNVSNVQGPNSRSIGDTELQPVTIRGFGAEQWLDGLPIAYSAGDRDAFAHVERIEVLKGPSAILYGGGAGAPIGGAINVVSKLPTDVASGEFGFRFGSNEYVLPYFDINQPLSPFVFLRVTAEYTDTNSSIDVLEQDRYSINPSLTLTNRSDTTLTVQGRVSKSQQQTYQGLPAFGTVAGDYKIDRDLFIGPRDIDRSYSESRGMTVSLDHKINPVLSASVKARFTRSESEQNTQVLQSLDPTGAQPLISPSTWLVANSQLYQEQDEVSINPSVQARFLAGPTRNTFLVGGDYGRVRDEGRFAADYLGNACGAVLGTATIDLFPGFIPPTPLCNFNAAGLIDLAKPAFGSPFTAPDPSAQYFDTTSFAAQFPPPLGFGPIPQVLTFSDATSTYTTKGLYGQVQSTLFDRVHLLGGLRLANVQIDYFDEALVGQQRFETDETKLLPRAGAVVDLIQGVSVYASYSEGLKGVPYSSRFADPKAEESTAREAGFKFALSNQFSGTVSYFEIERSNVPVTVSLGLGGLTDQRSTGYEADVIWQPVPGLQVIASYGYTDAEFADDFLSSNILVEKGNKLPGVPEHSGRVWVNYAFDERFMKGWSIGAGVYLASNQFVDNLNLYETESYHTVDAKIAYETKNFVASFNIKNLTEEEYFVPYAFLGGQVAPGDDRAYYGSVAYKY